MNKLILVIVVQICQGMKDWQTQTINLSGGHGNEHRFLSKILSIFQNINELKKEVSKGSKDTHTGNMFRKFFKQLLSNKLAKAKKKMNGFIEIQLKKKQPDEDSPKTVPIVVNGQRYSRFLKLS